MEKDENYLKAKKKVENLKGFYIHLTVYIFVNLLLIVVNLLTDASYLWFLYPLGGWGLGILIHGLTTFANGNFGDEWEKRKIEEYMKKDNKDI